MSCSFIECRGGMEEGHERPGSVFVFSPSWSRSGNCSDPAAGLNKGETGRDAIGACDEIKPRESPGWESRVNGVDEIMLKVNV